MFSNENLSEKDGECKYDEGSGYSVADPGGRGFEWFRPNPCLLVGHFPPPRHLCTKIGTNYFFLASATRCRL